MGTGRNLTNALSTPPARPTYAPMRSALQPPVSARQTGFQRLLAGFVALASLAFAVTAEARESGAFDLGAPELGNCTGLQQASSADEWALLEYEVGPAGIELDAMELEHSSSWTYGASLRECVVAGLAQLPRRGEGLHTLFRYRPSRHLQESSDGRRLAFEPSDNFLGSVRGLAGNLAVRVEIDDTGRPLNSELLFASNLDLGALVLDHFQDSVSVVAEGTPGAKVDIVYFRFENGQVVTFSQLHYSPRH